MMVARFCMGAARDYPQLQRFTSIAKATPNKFPVSRPELMQNSMRAGGPFPLFHYFLNGSETS